VLAATGAAISGNILRQQHLQAGHDKCSAIWLGQRARSPPATTNDVGSLFEFISPASPKHFQTNAAEFGILLELESELKKQAAMIWASL